MGLDMYLNKRVYVGAHYDHRKVHGSIKIWAGEKPIDVNFNRVSEIIEQVGYWRKSNQIHNWFVQNVQGGVDECQETYASYEKLMELKGLCEEVLNTKDHSKLPPVSGFFFGSTEVDDYYYEDLRHTVKVLSDLDPDCDYYYRSSW